MTWMPVTIGGESERAAVLGLQAEAFACYRDFLDAVAAATDPELLEVCRARIAQMLGCREELARHTPERLAEVAAWERSPAVTERQRAALAFAEQFVMDPSLIDRDLAAELENALGAEAHVDSEEAVNFGTSSVVNFATAIAVFEYSIRLGALLDFEPANPA